MSAIDDIGALVDAMQSRKGEMTSFEGLLSEISIALGDILACLEKPESDDDSALVQALLTGLRELRINPEIHVNVPSIAAPEVHINVQPAQVVVMPPEETPITGWALTVTGRDGNGQIRTLSFKPEK
jgi:hypothetical protein